MIQTKLSTMSDPEQIPSTELSGYYAWTHTLQGVYYGPGSVSTALPKLLDTFGASKAMVVTGNSLYTKVCLTLSPRPCSLIFPTTQTDVVKKVEGILREQNRYAATFYNIGEHSPISGIRAGVNAFKESGADIIVSVGGGSPIDASKAIIYFLHEQLGGEFLRQIAIPTTLSAAEYSVWCTVDDV
jgi:alcohol dehydrogenase class IV